MSRERAFEAVDALLENSCRSSPVTIGFLGGEPLLERELLRDVVAHAALEGARVGQPIRFSITTNGTLLEPEDCELFRAHPFAVTISLDGAAPVHDKRRLTIAGRQTHATIVARVRALLDSPGRAVVTARATVVRDALDLTARYDALAAVGFRSIGLSPVRVGEGALTVDDMSVWLDEMTRLAEREASQVVAGAETAFDNFRIAMRQIHRGHAAPYPCGAGGGYFSVSVDGEWYACHRAIGDDKFRLGTSAGLDVERRATFLSDHHVDSVDGCRTCWARYLCSGACHQEASARTREGCDAIRKWLEVCLDLYCWISSVRPAWLDGRSYDHAG
jgi:uncharacterized protein